MASRPILELAVKFNNQVHAERISAMRQLAASLPGQDVSTVGTATRSLLRQKLRGHLNALIRASSETEKLLRAGRTPPGIPCYAEMSCAQWTQSDGPFHVRWLAKTYGLLGPILPYNVEVSNYARLIIGSDEAKRGNFIAPSASMWTPTVTLEGQPGLMNHYSLVILDADYPVDGLNQRHQFGLWAKLNVRPNKQGKVEFNPSQDDPWTCIPPHPARGSDTHRILACVFEHSVPLDISTFRLFNSAVGAIGTETSSRLLDVRLLLGNHGVNLAGIQFYRTCWTKKISEFYTQMGI